MFNRFPVIALTLLVSAQAAWAFGDQKIIRSVNAGATVIIRNFIIYELNPCRSMPTPSIDARTPAFGRVTSAVVEVAVPRGPCDLGFKYQALRVSYQAGATAAIDNFTLYVNNGSSFTPIPVEIRIGGRAQQANNVAAQTREVARPVEKPSSTTKPPTVIAQNIPSKPLATTQILSGRYANNLGNIVSIENGVIYFTGYWNREKVERKPFAIITHDGNEFEWGVYKCIGNPVEFRCSNMSREQTVIYRRLD